MTAFSEMAGVKRENCGSQFVQVDNYDLSNLPACHVKPALLLFVREAN